MKPLVHLLIHELHEKEHLGAKTISRHLGIPQTTVARHLRQPRMPSSRKRPISHLPHTPLNVI